MSRSLDHGSAGALGFWFASTSEGWGEDGVIVTSIVPHGSAHKAGMCCSAGLLLLLSSCGTSCTPRV